MVLKTSCTTSIHVTAVCMQAVPLAAALVTPCIQRLECVAVTGIRGGGGHVHVAQAPACTSTSTCTGLVGAATICSFGFFGS